MREGGRERDRKGYIISAERKGLKETEERGNRDSAVKEKERERETEREREREREKLEKKEKRGG